jgi:lysozyme
MVNVNIVGAVAFGFIVITSLGGNTPLTTVRAITSSTVPDQNGVPGTAIALIKEFENFYPEAYLDPVGVPTIGWGTTRIDGKPVQLGMKISKEEGEKYLAADLASAANSVKGLVKVPLNASQFGALVSFTYNCGEGTLKSSSLLQKVNAGDYPGAAQLFPLYNKGVNGKTYEGLTRRRLSEQKMFTQG